MITWFTPYHSQMWSLLILNGFVTAYVDPQTQEAVMIKEKV